MRHFVLISKHCESLTYMKKCVVTEGIRAAFFGVPKGGRVELEDKPRKWMAAQNGQLIYTNLIQEYDACS